MVSPDRCKYCLSEPYSEMIGDDWFVYCNCLYFHSNRDMTYGFSLHDDAIRYWNKNFGINANDYIGKNHATNSVPINITCTCDSQDLFWHGCRCNYALSRKK